MKSIAKDSIYIYFYEKYSKNSIYIYRYKIT